VALSGEGGEAVGENDGEGCRLQVVSCRLAGEESGGGGGEGATEVGAAEIFGACRCGTANGDGCEIALA